MSSISSVVLVDSALGLNEPGCAQLPSVRSILGAGSTSPITGRTSLFSRTSKRSKVATSDQLMLFAADSHARTLARQESESASTALAAGFGSKCCDWCESCDPVGSLLRTSLLSDIEAMTGFVPTWKRLVTAAGHSWWQLSTSELRKKESVRGLWQTPTTRDYKGQSGMGNRIRRGKNGRLHVANLCDQLVDAGRPDLIRSPTFREWMMGLPIGFTDSKPWATPSSRKSRKSLGERS